MTIYDHGTCSIQRTIIETVRTSNTAPTFCPTSEKVEAVIRAKNSFSLGVRVADFISDLGSEIFRSIGFGFWRWEKLVKDETLEPDEIPLRGKTTPTKVQRKIDHEVLQEFFRPYLDSDEKRFPKCKATKIRICREMMCRGYLPKERKASSIQDYYRTLTATKHYFDVMCHSSVTNGIGEA